MNYYQFECANLKAYGDFLVMKKILISFLFFLNIGTVMSQMNNNIWCFGDSARIDFNAGTPVAGQSIVHARGSCASVSDINGLLFYSYTGGYAPIVAGRIISNNDTIMQNGDSIAGQLWYHEHLIVPYPGTLSQFILFSLSETTSPGAGLFYSVVDMSYNGGLGKVISKNNLLINDRMTDGLAAVKHGNGRDWWVICKPHLLATSDTIYEYLITPNGVSPPVKINTGTPSWIGILNYSFSNDGKKLLLINSAGFIELFNFNRCTGAITVDKIIQNELPVFPNYFGSCFSPNDSLIYISSSITGPFKIRQYDLFAPSVLASEVVVANITGSMSAIQRSPGALKTAPDGKIYIACAAINSIGADPFPYPDTSYYPDNMYLATVDSPNVYGVGCNYNAYGFYLGGKRVYWGLPNNPDYEMGADLGSGCDTLTSLTPNSFSKEGGTLTAYPNPVEHTLTVHYARMRTRNAEIIIRDVMGKEVIQSQILQNTSEVLIDVRKLSKGVYFVQLVTDNEKLNAKFVKD